MMTGDLDWTADLGEAFLNQQEDVDKINSASPMAGLSIGNLESNNNQQVIIDGENIEIIPAQPGCVCSPV